jgi:hypothetical protein
MKSSFKMIGVGLVAAISAGCAYSPSVVQPNPSYSVTVDVYETKTPYSVLLEQTKRAVEDHSGDRVDDVFRLPVDREDTLHHYGFLNKEILDVCGCLRIGDKNRFSIGAGLGLWMDMGYDSSFYNTVHLKTVVEKDEEVSFSSIKVRPYNDYYVRDNRDYVYSDADFSVEVSKLRENRALLNFHYVEDQLVSLDDVSMERVFVPIDDNKLEVNYDRMSSPMTGDGVTMIKLHRQDHETSKIFMISIKPNH